ncbi:SAM-dependent methyltransferase [Mycolicibacterium boenickei]
MLESVSAVDVPDVPNTGRILDYWLGGAHHFRPDVEAAQVFDALFPSFTTAFRDLRSFTGRIAKAIAEQGIDQFLVFGAGVPTNGNVHEAVPEARVLYTDIDAVNIALGRQILAEYPHVDYAYCDVTCPTSLDRAEIERVLGPVRRLGVILSGVAGFLTDDQLAQCLRQLYDWAPGDSYLALDCDGEASRSFPDVLALLSAAGEPLTARTPERMRPILGDWQITSDGIRPVQAWRNESSVAEYGAFMYGCLLHKPVEL